MPAIALCYRCGQPRGRTSRAKRKALCRRCVSVRWGKRQSPAFVAQRDRWTQPTERPTLTGLPIGTVTRYGKIEGRGMRGDGERYYCVWGPDGAIQQVSAAQVEGR